MLRYFAILLAVAVTLGCATTGRNNNNFNNDFPRAEDPAVRVQLDYYWNATSRGTAPEIVICRDDPRAWCVVTGKIFNQERGLDPLDWTELELLAAGFVSQGCGVDVRSHTTYRSHSRTGRINGRDIDEHESETDERTSIRSRAEIIGMRTDRVIDPHGRDPRIFVLMPLGNECREVIEVISPADPRRRSF